MKNRILLNLGCGIYAKKGWINVDKYMTEAELKAHKGLFADAVFEKGATFVQADIVKMPFPDNYADRAECHEVLEHLPMRDIYPAVEEIHRVLKPGGILFLHVPSMDGLALDWLNMTLFPEFDFKHYVSVAQTIYGNQQGEGEFHKTPFNARYLTVLLGQCGFEGDVKLYQKGMKIPKLGEFVTHEKWRKNEKHVVLRNDTLFAEVKKV